jgi:YD repeat-containing protein
MYLFFLLIMLLPRLLLANLPTQKEILQSPDTPLATLYGFPETNICGVNVINGDYNYAPIDFNLPGADPLIFQRLYSSSNCKSNSNSSFYLWNHNHHSLTQRKKSRLDKLHCYITVSGGLSGHLPFRKKRHKSRVYYKVNREIFKKGVTNCGQGKISGRSNIKNIKVYYWKDGDLEVEYPDGAIHYYSGNNTPRRRPLYYLEGIIKPNGVEIIYSSDKLILNSIQLLNDKQGLSNKISFKNVPTPDEYQDYKDNEIPFSIESKTFDGKTAQYHFRSDERHKILLRKFESSHLPTEHYDYTHPYDGSPRLEDRYGKQHRVKIDYYQKGDLVDFHDYYSQEIDSLSHHARHRVKKIEVAVNGPDDLRTIAHFAYYRDREKYFNFTDAYDEYNHLTRFYYTRYHYRLSMMEKFRPDFSILRREQQFYGKTYSALEGDLVARTVEDFDDTIHYGENYLYDQYRNIIKKNCRYRRFTDLQAYPISIEGPQLPLQTWHPLAHIHLEGGEVKSTLYTYNELNLPTSEDDGRLKAFFSYHERNGKATSLLKSKLIKENTTIIKREFFEFDGNAGCTLKIEDNGSGDSPDDLTDVHLRKITKFINRANTFAGLPLEIEEWGADKENERRIARTVLHYDMHGYVEKELYYDAENQFAYEIQKIRDLQGNITCESNAEGQITHRKFNEYGCLLEEQGPMPDYHMAYEYNWLQRPIKETRYCNDGINLTTIRRYDLAGRLIKIKNPYGLNTHFRYDQDGNVTRILHPPIRTKSGWKIPEEHKEYNFLGHLISETDAKGAVTHYTPNDAGLPLEITYPDGTLERFRYSIYGEVIEKTERNGSKVVYTYDAFSRPTSEKVYGHEGNLLKETSRKYIGNLLLSETDGEGLETHYTYDYAGRVSEVHQGRALTKYLYDSLGRVQEEQCYYTKYQYIATQYKYDRLNQVIEKIVSDEKGHIHSRETTTYDADGNITSKTDSETHAGRSKTKYTYDPRGNLSSITDPLGNLTHYRQRYDVIFEGYNLPCLEVIDPAGVKTVTISDSQGSPVCVQVYSPFGELLSHEEMFYDLNGNLARKKQCLPKETIVTKWRYDPSSRLIEKMNGVGTDEQITTRYVYDSCGQLSEIHYADGSSKHRTHDALGRLQEEWSSDETIHYRYEYNRQDLPTKITNLKTNKTTIRHYTPEKDLKSEIFENGLEITYEYDRMHRVIECIYPDLILC